MSNIIFKYWLQVDSYPQSIRKVISELQSQINNIVQKPLNHLIAQKRRPKALRLYEPNIRPMWVSFISVLLFHAESWLQSKTK